MKNIRLVSGKDLDKMFWNGWTSRTIRPNETREDVINELKSYYSKIKVYQVRTSVRGYYQDVVMVKR